MLDTERSYWLGVEFGPVQKFIEASRSVRDLTYSSRILSSLATKTLRAAEGAGGKRLFPAGTGQGESMPNRFTVTFPSRAEAEAAGSACEAAFSKAWHSAAKQVHDHLKRLLVTYSTHWDACWDEQIESYWSIHWAVMGPEDHGAPGVESLLTPSSDLTAFQTNWQLLSVALAAQKQVRHYPKPHGIGRDKCTLFGAMEQMGPGTSLTEQAKFWEEVAKRSRGRIRSSDRLCAVGLVKRFADHAGIGDTHLGEHDTRSIALRAWLDGCRENPKLSEAVKEWESLCADLDDDASDEFLIDADLKPEGKEKLGLSDQKVPALEGARRKLLDAAKREKLGSPPLYYAILHLDGDKIGERLNQQKDGNHLEELSGKLTDFAEAVKNYAKDNKLHCVYAGGDDALLLMPLDGALSHACAIRKLFDEMVGATMSGGLIYLHHKHPLRAGLEAVRDAEKAAKKAGRNRLGWAVIKRSGGPESGVIDWDYAPVIEDLAQSLGDGASTRWLSHLQEIRGALVGDNPRIDPLRLLLHHQLKQMARHDEDADRAHKVERNLLDLFEHINQAYQNEKALERFERLVQLGSWATFLARTRRGRHDD